MKHTMRLNNSNKKTGKFSRAAMWRVLSHDHFSIPGPMQSYHDWYVEEITELEDSTIGMWSEPLKIAKWFFHLSYLYLSFTCLIISLVVGLLVSVLTG